MGNYKDHMSYARRGLWYMAFLVVAPTTIWYYYNGGALVPGLLFSYTAFFVWFGGAMLPDIDSPQAKPNQLAMQVLATITIAIAFAITLAATDYYNLSATESIPYYFCAIVIGLSFNWIVTHGLIERFTRHRGHTHSLVAAFGFGAAVGTIFALGGVEWYWVLCMGAMATGGYINHLICDEIFSCEPDRAGEWFSWRFILFDPDGERKKSFGTALKFWSGKNKLLEKIE